MRIAMLVLAFVYAGMAMLTAAVGSFADGGDIWSRLVLVLLHPLAGWRALATRPPGRGLTEASARHRRAPAGHCCRGPVTRRSPSLAEP